MLRMYKKMPKQAKVEFATALRNADAAGRILGTDLAKYNVKFHKPGVKIRKIKIQMKTV
jgi:hypothetical protein